MEEKHKNEIALAVAQSITLSLHESTPPMWTENHVHNFARAIGDAVAEALDTWEKLHVPQPSAFPPPASTRSIEDA